MENDFRKYGIINEPVEEMIKPKYDEITSLRVFLSSVGITDMRISQIIETKNSKENMYNVALSVCDEYESNRYLPERACYSEANGIKDRILIKFIANKLSLTECIEYTFLYLLNEIGFILFWNLNKKSMVEFCWNTLDNILSQEKYQAILKGFDQRMIACFKYFICNKGNMKIDEVMNWGYKFLKMNSISGSTIHGSLYQYLGEETVIQVLNRVIQVIIDSKSPSLRKILIDKKDNKAINKCLKFDTERMKKHKSFRYSYILGQSEIYYLNEDLKNISLLINSNIEITNIIGKVQMSVTDIDFTNESTRLDYTRFTSTGKIPKYPYKICVFTKRIYTKNAILSGYSCIIEYDTNQSIGKFKYLNTIKNKMVKIQGNREKGELVISALHIDGEKVM